jgi:ribosomal-protein-serine acetyltransferase
MFKMPIDAEIELILLQPWHAEELFDVTNHNRMHLRQYLPWMEQTNNVEHTRSFILSSLMEFAQNHNFAAGICLNGAIVGSIALHSVQWNSKQTSMGYWLSAEHVGKGIMTKACIGLLRYVFEEMRLNKVSIQARMDNERSKAIPERIGFRLEGILRQHEWADGVYHDHALYSLLAEEWFQRMYH